MGLKMRKNKHLLSETSNKRCFWNQKVVIRLCRVFEIWREVIEIRTFLTQFFWKNAYFIKFLAKYCWNYFGIVLYW